MGVAAVGAVGMLESGAVLCDAFQSLSWESAMRISTEAAFPQRTTTAIRSRWGQEQAEVGKIRRKFEVEFKRQVAEQIELGRLTVGQAAREYQISPSAIDRWRKRFRENRLVDKPSSRERMLEAENERLKAKIGDLVMQIEHQKKLQEYIERSRSVDTSVITAKNWDQYRKGAK